MSNKMSTKDKILYAALKSFLSIGIDQTSLNNIAEAVNIKKPSIYYHFKSKEDLVNQCINNILDDLEHRLNLTLNALDNPRAQLEAFYECMIEFHKNLSIMVYENHHQLVNLNSFFQSASIDNEVNQQRIERYYHNLQVSLIHMLSNGQKQGLIKNSINKEIISIDLISRIDGMISLSALYKNANINTQRHSLYESVWDSLKSDHTPKKKKILDYKSIDLGRKW